MVSMLRYMVGGRTRTLSWTLLEKFKSTDKQHLVG